MSGSRRPPSLWDRERRDSSSEYAIPEPGRQAGGSSHPEFIDLRHAIAAGRRDGPRGPASQAANAGLAGGLPGLLRGASGDFMQYVMRGRAPRAAAYRDSEAGAEGAVTLQDEYPAAGGGGGRGAAQGPPRKSRALRKAASKAAAASSSRAAAGPSRGNLMLPPPATAPVVVAAIQLQHAPGAARGDSDDAGGIAAAVGGVPPADKSFRRAWRRWFWLLVVLLIAVVVALVLGLGFGELLGTAGFAWQPAPPQQQGGIHILLHLTIHALSASSPGQPSHSCKAAVCTASHALQLACQHPQLLSPSSCAFLTPAPPLAPLGAPPPPGHLSTRPAAGDHPAAAARPGGPQHCSSQVAAQPAASAARPAALEPAQPAATRRGWGWRGACAQE